MTRISVIVPVYNTEKYIRKCLDSILAQKMNDYEIIVVNDGSKDNSADIIKEYMLELNNSQNENTIKYFEKENGGLSDARNYGVSKASGDYLCFVDSDDYIDDSLFQVLLDGIETGVDLIKYKCVRVSETGEIIEKVSGPVFEVKSGEDAFNELYSKDVLMEPAWLYLYKREFFLNNGFLFPVGKLHEDWAIVPYIVLNAKSVVSKDFYGYYYVQSSNSITRNNDDEKIRKRAYDMLEHYDKLVKNLSDLKISDFSKENFLIYMSNCLILKLEELPEKYHKEYISELKKRKIENNIKARNLKQLVKKIILKTNMKLYIKIR